MKPLTFIADVLSAWKPPDEVNLYIHIDVGESFVAAVVRACCGVAIKKFRPGEPLDDVHFTLSRMAAEAIRMRDEHHAFRDQFSKGMKEVFGINEQSNAMSEAEQRFEAWMSQFHQNYQKDHN